MSTTPDTDIEERLRAALTARAELVGPEDLAARVPVTPLVPARPRWQSPWTLLATAAAVLLVLGVALQVLGSERRTDVAPTPEPRLELPPDVGRDWEADDISSPARLDLDGDGRKEEVVFLSEPSDTFDGRIRMETTISGTGDEAYGVTELGSTIGTSPLEAIDADGDGDQELVLLRELDQAVVGGLYAPVVFDLREGLLVETVPDEPDLLLQGNVSVPGGRTEHYDLVRSHEFWIEDGTLVSSRSVDEFASGNMTLLRPESYVADVYQWSLDGDGILRAGDATCLVVGLETREPCGPDADADVLPDVGTVATETFGIGEGADFGDGFSFSARIEAEADPSLVVEGAGARRIDFGLEVADPLVSTVQPTSVLRDGASFLVTSGSDPTYLAVLVQDGAGLRSLQAVGEAELANEGGTRTWLTKDGSLVTVTAQDDGSWTAWSWQMVSGTKMTALPWGTVCFDDVDDPSTLRTC